MSDRAYTKEIVTVVVITYNSSDTVVDTLESIYQQDYGAKNIELIVSDDASKDETVSIVQSWLNIFGDKFHIAKLINNEVNGGISKNCNVAWHAATSRWIKTIAGDDMLLPGCVSDNMLFIHNDPGAKIVFSKMIKFGNDGISSNKDSNKLEHYLFSLQDKDLQRKILMRIGGISVAPSSFISTSLLKDVGYADTNYTSFEDLPLWLEILKTDRLFFLNKSTVKYRVAESTSNSISKVVNIAYLKDLIRYHEECLKEKDIDLLTSMLIIDRYFYLIGLLYYVKYFGNKRSRFFELISKARALFSFHKWYLLWLRSTI
ncbi:glycosyltransferase family 2 protein [Aeromonas salmonicida]|uniref:Glycosyltransferase domain protein n=1 Tax=Aeromonas salmonicida subsp. pectinolytica 34mel TaxID=1324960 RepID=T0QXF4_AERSA|nr:glycosyltransferase domain protein [Aeromonas salmonicida subsp. pectinolytica 34mel]EQC03838.1 family 2 glycosyl transferase [Aeromonas salmonicida subsp. pectinolytica 34mel]TNI18536.1 glycosyltransferase family 2 protein [Aeromonas salmonicida]